MNIGNCSGFISEQSLNRKNDLKKKGIINMERLYWINGIGFIALLKKYGYAWQSGENVGSGIGIMERIMEDRYAYVISVNHLKKTLGIYPLEIYAPCSPTADAEKYQRVVDRCGNFDDLENDLISVSAGGKKTC